MNKGRPAERPRLNFLGRTAAATAAGHKVELPKRPALTPRTRGSLCGKLIRHDAWTGRRLEAATNRW
jgi:hypothetical protein